MTETSLDVLARQWVEGRRRRGELTDGSAQTYLDWLGSLTRRSFAGPVAELDRDALLVWQESIGHRAPETRRKSLSVVSQFCRWLVAEGYLASNPTVTLVRIRQPQHKPRALPAVDVAKILKLSPRPQRRYRTAFWLRPAVSVMVGCGLRCCGVANLDLDDYDPIKRSLFVTEKGGHQRVLPVPEETARALDEYIALRGSEPGPLFLAVGSKAASSRRLSAKWISKRTKQLMADAGVHRAAYDGKTAHALRHTFATDVLASSGNDVLAVQELMGHASLDTTRRYLPLAGEDRMRSAVEGRTYGRPETHVRLHCDDCCADPAGVFRLRGACTADCGGWQRIATEAMTVIRQGDWTYRAMCPVCGCAVEGSLSAEAAKTFLDAGALRGLAV